VEKIRYFIEHPEQADAIARAGQARTLREHTYAHRMEEMPSLVQPYLAQRRKKA
jgi:spore maturation protein CgeB